MKTFHYCSHWLCKPFFLGFLLAALALVHQPVLAQDTSRVFLAGGDGDEQFHDTYQLTDGTWLVAGGADDLDWLPQGTPVSTTSIAPMPEQSSPDSRASGRVAFILHLDQSMDNIMRVMRLPDTTLADVYRIKSNVVPGNPADTLWVSGNRDNTQNTVGYSILKIPNTFLNGNVPSTTAGFFDVENRGRNNGNGTKGSIICEDGWCGGTSSIYREMHVWDVQSNGQIVYLRGQEFSDGWSELSKLKANMTTEDTTNWFPVTWAEVVMPGDTSVRDTTFLTINIDTVDNAGDNDTSLTIEDTLVANRSFEASAGNESVVLRRIMRTENRTVTLNANDTTTSGDTTVTIDTVGSATVARDTTTTELRSMPQGLEAFIADPVSFSGGKIMEVLSLDNSSAVMKVNRGGADFRSGSMADYNQRPMDANRQDTLFGRWPNDALFNGPVENVSGGPTDRNPVTTLNTELSGGNAATNLVGFIEIDKRTDALYIGYSTQTSTLGDDDILPTLMKLNKYGNVMWYDHLSPLDTSQLSMHHEYFRGVALDYANDMVYAYADVRGVDGSPGHPWRGNEITRNPGNSGFQNVFTGVKAGIDVSGTFKDRGKTPATQISWIGKYSMDSGRIHAATYVGEYQADGNPGGDTLADPNNPWEDPNTGGPNLSTTLIETLEVAPNGDVAIIASGMRTITTRDGYQRMPRPGDGPAGKNSFVRIYSSDLGSVKYSSLLTSQFETMFGEGSTFGNNNLGTRLLDLEPMNDAVVLSGFHNGSGSNRIPATNAPDWGHDTLTNGASGVLAKLTYGCTVPASTGLGIQLLSTISDSLCPGDKLTLTAIDPLERGPDFNPEEDYVWIISGNGYQGYSTSDSITVTALSDDSTKIILMVRNECGLSHAATERLPQPGNKANAPITFFPADIFPSDADTVCEGDTVKLSIPPNSSPRADRFVWSADSTIWQPANGSWVTTETAIELVPVVNSGASEPDTLFVHPENKCGLGEGISTALPPVCQAVGLNNELPDGAVELFPNPTEGKLQLELNSQVQGRVNIRVFDMLGKLQQQSTFTKEGQALQQSIDLSGLPRGLYTVEIRNGDRSSVEQISVQ